ncbi:hypothetical protein O0L34_g13498 [Tuta absoluta]|nr:hypothetical protein O0L34_g13498 [Tuta absoluta]
MIFQSIRSTIYQARVPTYKPTEKNIIMSFTNRYVKEEFIATARAVKDLSARDIGYTDSNQRIFLNDHLTPEMKALLTKVKNTAKDRNYLYVWVRYSKIHVRKNDTSHVIVISRENDLNKIV